MKKKNILITTLGTSWPVVPELIGFTNPLLYDFYQNHPKKEQIDRTREEYKIEPVDECWVITTNGKRVKMNLVQLKKWASNFSDYLSVRYFSTSGIKEFNDTEEVTWMTDLVFRVVLKARHDKGNGKIYLSLAGGRKTMSADMMLASDIFGSNALLHVMDSNQLHDHLRDQVEAEKLVGIPSGEIARCITPIIIQGNRTPNPLSLFDPEIQSKKFTIRATTIQASSTDFAVYIKTRLQESGNILVAAYNIRLGQESQTSFLAMQLLSPDRIENLKNTFIGVFPERKKQELEWLQKLPKPELHCHLGGILLPDQLIETALASNGEISHFLKINSDFHCWQKQIINEFIKSEDYNFKDISQGFEKNLRRLFPDIPKPLVVSAFISAFKEKPGRLVEFIYRNQDLNSFKKIGISEYEILGDLQGSGLLQSENSIRKTCEILKKYCSQQNIRYLELRCSPLNYTNGGLNPQEVLEILMDELEQPDIDTRFKLILIASRHGHPERVFQTVKFTLDNFNNSHFRDLFAGFDLAGNEAAKSPKELREAFLPLLQKCVQMTIHAGETKPVSNIWEAVYHLNADRIGHGLTLLDQPELLGRFRDKKIAIEMCPSSNDQIVGFRDFQSKTISNHERIYPLKKYFDYGLKVTINTDNPGISLTNLSYEYYKAAMMTKGGLSKWDVLQIIRNGFQAAFLPIDEKKELLRKVENELVNLLD